MPTVEELQAQIEAYKRALEMYRQCVDNLSATCYDAHTKAISALFRNQADQIIADVDSNPR